MQINEALAIQNSSNPFGAMLNRPNYQGLFSIPNLYTVAMMGNDSYRAPIASDTPTHGEPIFPTQANDSRFGINLGQYPIECLTHGLNCPDGTIVGSISETIAGFMQKFALLLFALLLVGFGLYMLAKNAGVPVK
jgi:hypothetical protein